MTDYMKCIFITKTTKVPKSTYLSPLLHNEHSAKDVADVPNLQAPMTKTKTPLLNT